MPDNLGPGEYANVQLTIDFLMLTKADATNQRLDNDMTVALNAKQSGEIVEQIHTKYNREESLVRSKMRECGNLSDEYFDLRMELEELENEEDEKVKAEETRRNDIEKHYEIENTELDNTITDCDTNLEQYKSLRDENIKGQ